MITNQNLIDFFTMVNDIEYQQLFKYIIIFIISSYMFSKVNIGLNNIIGGAIGLVIVFIMIGKVNSKKDSNAHELNNKYNSIIPLPIHGTEYPEIIEYLHSIREFYFYNKRAFSSMVKNFDMLIQIYKNVKNGVRYCKYHYDIASEKRKSALNNLHSIIYSLEDDRALKHKLIESVKYLQVLTGKYLNYIENICNDDIEQNGYNIEKSKIESDQPRPFNIDDSYNNNLDNVFSIY